MKLKSHMSEVKIIKLSNIRKEKELDNKLGKDFNELWTQAYDSYVEFHNYCVKRKIFGDDSRFVSHQIPPMIQKVFDSMKDGK